MWGLEGEWQHKNFARDGLCLTLKQIFMQLEFRYADLLDDVAFKLVFGQESTKNVMIEFLNQVIPDRQADLYFHRTAKVREECRGVGR